METAETVRQLLDYDPETGVFRWRVDRNAKAKNGTVAGYMASDGYLRIKMSGKSYAAHCIAWVHVFGEWPLEFVDHINGERADNRVANLRLANNSQNQGNSRKNTNSTTGMKGVSFHKLAGKFRAQIKINGRKTHIGIFDTAEEAHAAYCAAAEKHFGEFARFE